MYDTFVHSVKVPRLYKVAANIAKQYSEGVGSIKHLVYGGKKKHPNLKAIFALVTTLYDKSDEIENLLKRSKILEKESRCDHWLTKILIVELLWGKGALLGQSKPENTVRGYEQIFKAHLTDKPIKKTEVSLKPRYVRVNTLSLITDEAIQNFQDEGWVLSKFFDKNDYDGFLHKISNIDDSEFMVDIHIPDLLIFPPKTEFYNHPAYNKASILLQDKASCLPVHILAPPPGSTVLDMCAAPGMKTTHLAAVLKNQGTVYAVEKDPKRYTTLEAMIADSGATCVKTFNKDVLECSAEDFPGVEYILVDPSCTGSGIAERYYSDEKIDSDRVQKLAGFQIKILRTALKKYPDAKRVVYSTCSILPEENEDVVRQVIETNYNFKLVPAKQFVSGAWKNFGSPDYGELGAHCLYTKPDEDFTNGFFVAVFERLPEGEENKFFNNKIYSYKRGIDKKERRLAKKLERERKQNEENIGYDEFSNQNIEQEQTNPVLKERMEETENYDNQEKSPEILKKKKKKKRFENDGEGAKDGAETVEDEFEALSHKTFPEGNIENVQDYFVNKKNKKHKKRKVTEAGELETLVMTTVISEEVTEEIPRKKKKKDKISVEQINGDDNTVTMDRNKKIDNISVTCENDKIVLKKNKKKNRDSEIIGDTETGIINDPLIEEKSKSKQEKNNEGIEDSSLTINSKGLINILETHESGEMLSKKKKKKKKNIDYTENKEKSKSKKNKNPEVENS